MNDKEIKPIWNMLRIEVPRDDDNDNDNDGPCKSICFYTKGDGLTEATLVAMRDFVCAVCHDDGSVRKMHLLALFGKQSKIKVDLRDDENVACKLHELLDTSSIALPTSSIETRSHKGAKLFHNIRLLEGDVRISGPATAFMIPNERMLMAHTLGGLPEIRYGATFDSFFEYRPEQFRKAIETMVIDARTASMLDRYLAIHKAAGRINSNYSHFY